MKRSYVTKLLVLLLPVFFAVSCTPQKKLKYLQGSNSSDTLVSNYAEHVIQKGDILYIKILGLDEKFYNFFNTQDVGYGGYNNITVYLNSYNVNDSGTINVPIIGSIHVGGRTILNAQKEIQLRLDEYIKNGTAILYLGNFSFSILGEVAKPGTYNVYDHRLNIFQALGIAGDMTVYGVREKVTIIRNYGKSSTINYVNLNSKDILKSEFYYILPNDIIYIEPHKAKSWGFATFPLLTTLTGISTLLLIINTLSK